MKKFTQVSAESLELKPFEIINKSWMLITAGNKAKFNTMTASWGGLGTIWNKSAATCYIRPTRYTFEFVENSNYFTLCFLGEKYKDVLSFCGTKSGRDTDKVANTGLTPVFDENCVYFEQADMVLICKKMYAGELTPKGFVTPEIESFYPLKDYHKMYIGEVVKVLVKQ